MTLLPVPDGSLIAWDLPVQAAGMSGCGALAALAARYLADRRSGTVGEHAARCHWVMRHGMQPDRSCFSFWAPVPSPDAAERLGALGCPVVDPQLLSAVKREHLAHSARRADDPTASIERALHVAAWAETDCRHTGHDDAAVSETDADLLTAYLAAVVPQARTTVIGAAPAQHDARPAHRGVDPRKPGWRAGLEMVHKPWSQFAVGVMVALGDDRADETELALLRELLGSRSDGMLAAQLRGAQGIAYAAGASARIEHGRPVLLACANTDRDGIVKCAQALRATASSLPDASPDDWRAAAVRLRFRTEAALDHPFARLDDARRASSGQLTLSGLLASIDPAVQRLIEDPPAAAGEPARAVVGNLYDALRELVTQWI